MGVLDSEMKIGLDFDKISEDVTGVLDAPTTRLTADLTSPFKLPQIIRPITAIWAMSMYTIVAILSLYLAKGTNEMNTVTVSIFASITGILMSIIGFYFNSRKQEKIQMKNAQATIAIEKMRLESKIELEEMRLDSDLDDEKLERKIKNRESRRKGRFRLFDK